MRLNFHRIHKVLFKNKILLFLTTSVLLHAFFVFIIGFLKSDNTDRIGRSESIVIDIVEGNGVNKDQTVSNEQPKGNEEFLQKKKQVLVHDALKNKINFTGKTSAEIFEEKLLSKLSASTNQKNSGTPYFKDNDFRPSYGNYDSYEESGAYGYLEKGGIKKIFEQSKFYSEVWKKVRHLAGFPKDFLNFRLQGNVRIHVLLDQKGNIIGDFLKVSSEADPLLELYSMAVLAMALEEPLHKSFWAKDKQIPMVFEFKYNHTHSMDDEQLSKSEMKLKPEYQQGNILKFVSTRFIDPKVVQIIHELYKDFFPPVMLMPGGLVMIDPILLYQKIQHWKKNGFELESTTNAREIKSLRKEILLALQTPSKNILNRLSNGHYDFSRYEEQSQKSGVQVLRSLLPSTREGAKGYQQ